MHISMSRNDAVEDDKIKKSITLTADYDIQCRDVFIRQKRSRHLKENGNYL